MSLEYASLLPFGGSNAETGFENASLLPFELLGSGFGLRERASVTFRAARMLIQV